MQARSRQVASNQPHLNAKLAATVLRHLQARHRRPAAAHNLAAFRRLESELCARPRPLVLDSFCGTGHSSAMLAGRHPGHLVVGIDKSAARLARHPGPLGGGDPAAGAPAAGDAANNYLLLQAECEDLWQLLVQAGIGVDHHYLFYPNPWPKAKHLQRRVHGSAGFPLLLQLAAAGGNPADPARAGCIELRSNWQVYVEEFGVAMQLAGIPGVVARVQGEPAISLFERKYRDSGHELWAFTCRVRRDLRGPACAARPMRPNRDGKGLMG